MPLLARYNELLREFCDAVTSSPRVQPGGSLHTLGDAVTRAHRELEKVERALEKAGVHVEFFDHDDALKDQPGVMRPGTVAFAADGLRCVVERACMKVVTGRGLCVCFDIGKPPGPQRAKDLSSTKKNYPADMLQPDAPSTMRLDVPPSARGKASSNSGK